MKIILTTVLFLFIFSGCETNNTKGSYIKEIKAKIGKEAMVLEIGSSTCKSCKEMKEIIDELKGNDPDIPIHMVDVYDDMTSFSYFNIKLIPTQIAYDKNGKEVFRNVGKLTKQELLDAVALSQKGE